MDLVDATLETFWSRYSDDFTSITTSCSLRYRTSCARRRYFRSMLLVCRPDPTNMPMQNNTVAPAITKRMISIISRTALRHHDSPGRCHNYLVPAPEDRLCSVPGSADLQMVGGCS